jgi:stage II sporulation protein M
MKRKYNKKLIYPICAYILGYLFGLAIVIVKNQKYEINPKNLQVSTLIYHNSSVIFMLLVGVITGGIITLLILFINGATLGITIHACLKTTSLSKLLLLIVPHGIFEIPAFIIAAIGDLYLVSFFMYIISNRKSLKKNQISFKELKIGVICNIAGIILVVIAGFIEAYV